MTPSQTTMPDLSGQQLGPYRLEKKLGQGGMAAVYLSYQEGLKRRPVAVKVLAGMQATEQAYVDRFEREVELAARLEHPHILPVYDFGVQGGYSYLAMRLAEGGTLQEQAGRLSQDYGALLDILGKIAAALDYAHGQGVIHRDIKASNILFDKSSNPYLADFGIAKIISDPEISQLTGTNQLLGTPNYMSPEQWRGEELDSRADVYSFAVMAYHLLSGHFPFEGPTPFVVMHKHLYELPADLPQVSPLANQILARALSKTAQDRYASLGEFMRALSAALSGPPEARTFTLDEPTLSAAPSHTASSPTATLPPDYDPTPPSPRPRSGRGPIFAALGLLILLGLIGAGALILSGGEHGESRIATKAAVVSIPHNVKICGTRTLDLCVYDIGENGGQKNLRRHPLALVGQIFEPISWAPDGRRLVFSYAPTGSDISRDRALYILDTDTDTLTALPKVENDTYAVWWPGGDWIAYHSSCNLGLMRADGSESFILWPAPALVCVNDLAWSPGGQYLGVWWMLENGKSEVGVFTFNPESPLDSPYKALYQVVGELDTFVWTPGTELLVAQNGIWRSLPELCWESSSPCTQGSTRLYTDPIRDSWWPNYSPQWDG